MSVADFGSPSPSAPFFASSLPTSQMVTVPIVDDTISELSPEEFTLMLMLVSNTTAVTIAPDSTRVLLGDDDCE